MKGESPFLLPEKPVWWLASVSTWVIPLLPQRWVGISGTRFLSSSVLSEDWLHCPLSVQPFCMLCAMVSDLEGAQKPDDFTTFPLGNLTGMKRVDISPATAERVALARSTVVCAESFRNNTGSQTGRSPSLVFCRNCWYFKNYSNHLSSFCPRFPGL